MLTLGLEAREKKQRTAQNHMRTPSFVSEGKTTLISERKSHGKLTRASLFYSSTISTQEHINFGGLCEEVGPVLISMCIKPDPSLSVHPILIRTKCGDYCIDLPAEKAAATFSYSVTALFQSKSTRLIKAVQNTVSKMDADFYWLANVKFRMLDGTPEYISQLKAYEDTVWNRKFKVGVVYAKTGQRSPLQVLQNCKGSLRFYLFLDCIGQRTKLSNFQGFNGGLDTKQNRTGDSSYYAEFEGNEIMFLVSTLIPLDKKERGAPITEDDVITKRSLIGNAIVVIVFNDGEEDEFDPTEFASKCNQIFIVVTPVEGDRFSIRVLHRKDVKVGEPFLLSDPYDLGDTLTETILRKVVMSERAVYTASDWGRRMESMRIQLLLQLLGI